MQKDAFRVTVNAIRKVRRVKPGETGRTFMPYSDVCMHMQVAGKPMRFLLQQSPRGYVSVQLFENDVACGKCDGIGKKSIMTGSETYKARCVYCEGTGWRKFSASITTGEAGVHQDDQGFYFYPADSPQMMPRQEPYTAEELERLQALISDAAEGDRGETEEECL